MSLTKIGSIGINTGIQLAGVTTVSTLHVGSGVTLSSDGDGFFTGITTFTRNVTGDFAVRISNTHATGQGLNIRGGSANGQYALLVEDYAAANLFEINGDGEVEVKANHLRANHGVVVTGIVTAANFAGGGANLTDLNASNLASGTVPTARLGSGTASSSTFLRGDSTFQTVNTDLVSDTSPQLGGNLDVNTKNITFGDSGGATDDRLTFGAGTDLSIYHDGSHSRIDETGTGNLMIQSDNAVLIKKGTSENIAVFNADGPVELYHDNIKRLATYNEGIEVFGAEGGNASIKLSADEGDDNNDQYRLIAGNGTSIYLQNYASGSWESNIVATGNGAVELYNNNVKTFSTDANGIQVYGPEGEAAQILLYSDEGDDNADKWRIYNTGGNFLKWQTYASGSWQDAISAQSQNQVRLFYNGSEKLNTSNHGISLTGKIYMNNGNVQFGSAGNGIDFSATSDASGMTSELLDDYEEGTWTPTATHFTIATQYSANYTKIGNVVYIQAYIQAATGSGASAVSVGGLPYTVKGSSYYSYAACRIGGTNAQHNMVFQFGSGSTTATPFVYEGNINEGMISGQHLIFSGFYHAA